MARHWYTGKYSCDWESWHDTYLAIGRKLVEKSPSPILL